MVCIFANYKKIFKVKNYTDIIIVGAGLSGVGAACHLERKNPEKSYVIFEAREELGGTWSLFKYPGIRSDSDMHTKFFKREKKVDEDQQQNFEKFWFFI